jgi:hypothetical protein
MALHPSADEVTPTDVHLVITPTARGQDLYAAIALPATVSCAVARRGARDMRRSAQGPRLEAACVAEVVLGDPAHRKTYDELRARAAAAGLPLPTIGAAMPAVGLPPPLRARMRIWGRDQLPRVTSELNKAFEITGRGLLLIFKITVIAALVILGIVCIARYAPPPRTKHYEVPEYHFTPIPEYRFEPPVWNYEPPKFEIPEIEVPDIDLTPDPPAKQAKPHKKPRKPK